MPRAAISPSKAPLSLASRLELLSRDSRRRVLSLVWLFALPAGSLLAVSSLMLVAFFGMLTSFSASNSALLPYITFALPLLFWLVGLAGGAWLAGYWLRGRFSAAYRTGWQQLQETELPVLVADEVYSLSLLDLVKDQLSFQFSGSPLPRSLEDQLLIAAAYASALRICQFSSTDAGTPMLREGGRGYLMTRVPSRVLRAAGSASFCLPYVSCLGYLWLPFAFIHAMRLCELYAVQAAIADFFSDTPERALAGSSTTGAAR